VHLPTFETCCSHLMKVRTTAAAAAAAAADFSSVRLVFLLFYYHCQSIKAIMCKIIGV